MNKYVNPSCNSPLATTCAKSVMASSCGEGKVAALFTEGVSSSAEWELEIDETVSTVSLAPNVCVVHGVSMAAREGEGCVEEFVDHLGGEASAARQLFWKEKLMKMTVMMISWAVSLQSALLSQSVGFLRMRWHVPVCRWRRWQRVLVLLTHLVCLHVSPISSLPISF